MSKGITISKEYGLNPSVLQCPICGKEHSLALFGTSWKDKNGKTAEAPRVLATPNSFCDDCRKALNQGAYIFIEVKDGETGSNPYRLGGFVGITTEAAKRMFPDIEGQVHYMEHTMFRQIFGEVLEQQKQNEA
jgi:hypothetical protein